MIKILMMRYIDSLVQCMKIAKEKMNDKVVTLRGSLHSASCQLNTDPAQRMTIGPSIPVSNSYFTENCWEIVLVIKYNFQHRNQSNNYKKITSQL